MLVCIKGKGYTYTWPDALGTTPWQDGKADKVMRQDYEPVGLVSAAPMAATGSTSISASAREPLRLIAWHGPNNQRSLQARPSRREDGDIWAIDIDKGGNAIPYHLEDPAVRREFEETLARGGCREPDEPGFYERPPAEGEDVPADMLSLVRLGCRDCMQARALV